MIKITAGDFLAGGGGVTEAMSQIPGMQVKWVLNHNNIAIRTNLFHHKHVNHYWADLYKQDEHEMEAVDFCFAGIECTQHSNANGGREKKTGSYMLGWEFLRYIKHLQPLVIGIENVPEFKKWAPLDNNGNPDKSRKGEEFEKWKAAICALGYDYDDRTFNAADFGIPTRRVRYFAFFVSKALNMQIPWAKPTHNKDGTHGLKQWVACKEFINLEDEGESIFGREFNPKVAKNKRHPLVANTLKRIAGGIKKQSPEMQFVLQYYGSGVNSNGLDNPLNTVRTNDCHALITVDKKQFVQDHCHNDNYNTTEEPLNPILTWQTKQLITIEKSQFLQDYYGRDNTAHSLGGPANTITTENSKHLITVENQLMVQHFSGDHSSKIDKPLPTITTTDHNTVVTAKAFLSIAKEKARFVIDYFNGSNEKQVLEALKKGKFDFDIKMRFLHPEELSMISTFPGQYFTNPKLKLTKKEQVKLIGNAVPPEWAKLIIEPVVKQLQEALTKKEAV